MTFFGECLAILIFFALPFLYDKSRSFRYYFKFFIYYFLLVVISSVMIPFMLFRWRTVHNLVLASKACKCITRVLGIQWEIEGKEYLEKDEPFVVVANHQSSIDVLGIFELAPILQKVSIIAKKELLYTGPFGIACWLSGLMFIDRLDPSSARQAINDSINQLVEDKTKLWVFPEGTRINTGTIHEFKKGAFHAAVKGQIPILPVIFSHLYFTGADKTLEIGRIKVKVLPPIPTEGLTTADISRLVADTRASMIKTFEQLNLQLRPSKLPIKVD